MEAKRFCECGFFEIREGLIRTQRLTSLKHFENCE
jgi:hypothetical protein